MRKQLLVCLKLEKISPFSKTNKRFYHCRSIPLIFYIYCICREAFFHDDIKSNDGFFMANFADNKVYELYNFYNENKGLVCRKILNSSCLDFSGIAYLK